MPAQGVEYPLSSRHSPPQPPPKSAAALQSGDICRWDSDRLRSGAALPPPPPIPARCPAPRPSAPAWLLHPGGLQAPRRPPAFRRSTRTP
eukprot:PRCOL_00006393-RA